MQQRFQYDQIKRYAENPPLEPSVFSLSCHARQAENLGRYHADYN